MKKDSGNWKEILRIKKLKKKIRKNMKFYIKGIEKWTNF
jgi:hypothetical protein